jgi:hypothetical protein
MKILTTSANAQTISFYPRAYDTPVTLYMRDNSTNATVKTQNLTLTRTKDKASISNTFTLIEGRFYDLRLTHGVGANWNTFTTKWEAATDNWENIISSENDVYLDKVFCTDQTIDQSNNDYYSINSGEYTETTSYPNDDYIIIS